MPAEGIAADFKKDFALFIEAGFIAVKQLDEIGARRLFTAAALLNPENPASQLGLGYIALNKLQVTEATKIFELVLKDHPDHDLAKALLGIAYLLSKNKRPKGVALVKEAKESTSDPTIKNLADTCLDWYDKDLKQKSASPLIPAHAEEEE